MIADMINNKRLNPVVAELLIRGRKVNISVVFIMQSFLKYQKKLDWAFFLIKFKIKENINKRITVNHS